MIKDNKVQTVDRLSGFFSECNVGILTNYQGLTSPEITALRRKLEESGIKYRVVKNTLARIAAEKSGKGDLGHIFEGPVAVAFGFGDIVASARALTDYIRTSKATMVITGGFLGDRLLTAEEVTSLAKLPAREVLIGRVLGGMQSPITGLINCLSSPLRGMINVLQGRIQQLERR
jgi:large subunit ribosomal protein L10